MNNNRILVITNWLRKGGGAEKISIKIINILSENFDVTLFVMQKEFNDLECIINKNVNIIYLNDYYKNTSMLKLFKYILFNKYDFCFTTNHRLAVIVNLYRFLLFKDFMHISRNISNLSLLMINKPKIYNEILRKIYNKTDLVIVQSRGMQEDLILNYNFNFEQTKLVYNPINLNTMAKHKESNNSDIKKILFVGRLRPEKGFEFILHAFKQVLKYYPKAFLEIMGEGYLKDSLVKQCIDFQIENQVKFYGFKNDLSEYYMNADLLVLCSHYEGFPNVLVEANSFGLPVVSCNSPFGPSEIIIDGVNGFLANYKDPNSLKEKILLGLEHEWNYNEIINTTKRFNENNFKEIIKNIFYIGKKK